MKKRTAILANKLTNNYIESRNQGMNLIMKDIDRAINKEQFETQYVYTWDYPHHVDSYKTELEDLGYKVTIEGKYMTINWEME